MKRIIVKKKTKLKPNNTNSLRKQKPTAFKFKSIKRNNYLMKFIKKKENKNLNKNKEIISDSYY